MKQPTIPCPECGIKWWSRNSMLRHFEKVHIEGEQLSLLKKEDNDASSSSTNH